MPSIEKKLAGKFLVIDGPDGAGKSTQLDRLENWLVAQAVPLTRTRDPGGTPIGDRIRQILLDPTLEEMAVPCELLLYMASRAQLMVEVVRPALASGRCVLCDRFVSATLAYQGAGGADTRHIMSAAELAVGNTWPDLTIILDVDAQTASARMNRTLDRVEAKGADFHRRVREGFLHQAADDPHRFAIVDATADVETVEQRIRDALIEWAR